MCIRDRFTSLSTELGDDIPNNLASSSDQFNSLFGLFARDIPLAGDFDGNGQVEPAVVRGVRDNFFGGLFWFSLTDDGMANTVQWGLTGDQPFIDHFDADTKVDRVVVRDFGGGLFWFVLRSESAPILGEQWGLSGDSAATGDFNGDGVSELVVSRVIAGQLTWFIRSVDGSFVETIPWGLSNDVRMAPSDFDGDGVADLAVARSTQGLLTIFVRLATGEAEVFSFGLANDIPFFGFYESDEKAELSVYRRTFGLESRHFSRRNSSNLNSTTAWGLFGDWFLPPGLLGVAPQ